MLYAIILILAVAIIFNGFSVFRLSKRVKELERKNG